MIELESILTALTSNQVHFVIIGGVAITAHGSAYVTRDLDIAFLRTRENTDRICKALLPINPRPRGFPERLPFVFDSSTLLNGTNFTLETDLGDLDLLGEVAGVGTYQDVFEASVAMNLLGNDVRVLSIDGLIAAKRAAGRPKDMLVLPELEALKEALSEEE